MNTDNQLGKQEACFARGTQVWLAVNHKPVSLLADKFDVRSVLHGQVSLATVNQIYAFHEAMNGCINPKVH